MHYGKLVVFVKGKKVVGVLVFISGMFRNGFEVLQQFNYRGIFFPINPC